LKSGTELFFVTSAAQALSIILLHTFWSVIFFNAFDTNNYLHIAYVVGSHLFVSLISQTSPFWQDHFFFSQVSNETTL